jgi:transcriptional regulator with XRE-family HTH domain
MTKVIGGFPMPHKVFGKCLLLELLNRSYMTQDDLATKTCIDPAQISKYINNKRYMTMKNAALIAHALKCNIDDLYEWTIKE